MADYSSILDSLFPFRSDLFPECLARDNETLTKALQIALSDTNSSCSSGSSAGSVLNQLAIPEPAGLTFPDPVRTARGALNPTGRVTKRKSRASKRTQTTYINADPANFRQMVQQVTGIRFGQNEPVEPVIKPEMQREHDERVVMLQNCPLPTLDTSAVLLDRECGSVGPVPVERTGFGFEPVPSFPTLDSWGTIM